jgi:hypothetical protein
MGLLSALGITNKNKNLQAQFAPAVMGDNTIQFGYNTFGFGPMDRTLATQVPAVNRCLNLIKGVVGYLPLELYKKSTGQKLGKPLWLEQPDIRQPRSVTLSWTTDSLVCMARLSGELQKYLQMMEDQLGLNGLQIIVLWHKQIH